MGAVPSHEAHAESGLCSIRFCGGKQELCLVPLTSRFFPNSTCGAFQALYQARCQDKTLFTFLNSTPGNLQPLPNQELHAYWDLLIAKLDSICYETNEELRDAVRETPKLLRPVPCAVMQVQLTSKAESAKKTSWDPSDGGFFELGNGKVGRVIGFFNLRNTNEGGRGTLTGGVFLNRQFGSDGTGVLLELLVLAAKMFSSQCANAGIVLNTDPRAADAQALDLLVVPQLLQHDIDYEFLVTNYPMLRFTVEKMMPLLALIPNWENHLSVTAEASKLFLLIPCAFLNLGLPTLANLATYTPVPSQAVKSNDKKPAATGSTHTIVLQPFQDASHSMHLPYIIKKYIKEEYDRALASPYTHEQWNVITPKLCLWRISDSVRQSIEQLMKQYPRPQRDGSPTPAPVIPLLGVVPDCTEKFTDKKEREWIVANAESCLGRSLTSGNSTSGKGFEFPTFSAFLNAAAEYASRTAPPNSDRWTSLSHRGGFYRLDSPPGVTATIQVRISQPWFLQLPEVKEQIERIESQIKEELTAWNALHADDDPVTQGAKEKQRIYFRSTDKNEEVSFELLVRYAGPNPLQDLHFEGPMCVPSRQVSTASFGSTNSSGAAAAAAVKSNSTQSLSSAASSQEPACTINTFHFAEDFFLELSKKEISTRQRFRNAPYKPE